MFPSPSLPEFIAPSLIGTAFSHAQTISHLVSLLSVITDIFIWVLFNLFLLLVLLTLTV